MTEFDPPRPPRDQPLSTDEIFRRVAALDRKTKAVLRLLLTDPRPSPVSALVIRAHRVKIDDLPQIEWALRPRLARLRDLGLAAEIPSREFFAVESGRILVSARARRPWRWAPSPPLMWFRTSLLRLQ